MTKHVTNQKHTWLHQGESMRLDQFLKSKFEGISRAYLQQLIEDEKVVINQAIGKKGSMVHRHDQVKVEPFTHPDDRMIQAPDQPYLDIVFESDHYIVIDKQAGLPTHPNEFQDRNCVANHFIGLYPDSHNVGEDALRPGIVHRLDTNTSGLLVLAKTQEGYTQFRQLFDKREMKKTYQALVLGVVLEDTFEIETPLAHHHKNPRKMVAVVDQKVPYRSKVRPSKTMVKVLERFVDTTLVEVKTLTGRMHQVRVHLSSVGHPLVGDGLYQDQKQKNLDRFKLDRHFLHASELRFNDPWMGQPMAFTSNLPETLERTIEALISI